MNTGLKLAVRDVTVRVRRWQGADLELPLPSYASGGAAGMDLLANFGDDKRQRGISLMPGGRALIPTGLAVEIPRGYEIQVRPRSGLALRHGVTVANAPGTIDSDYRGQIGVILINQGHELFDIGHGDRIAQMVLAPVTQIVWDEVDSLGETARGEGGFGSTGRSTPRI
ncbi:dUTP diphosphatase [Pontivivens insulae]|uniref:Deoxyuridine 5'-triphosphate nucleotidohydrolase n=1 Tax=Pontivivens insulae TaxID=1639689 RepID=A0A2R8AES4_9RHOB|nr:dUTP diphosphatase [Pontivivens insulae]RED11808.1 deoxyuridine 5'-triphosphate nucleotidohydrolase [Pontivivens insulae]SPF30565.1 Deoxyuridine 5'-triphosphate nucleotidohydrolase [Pontivivens insulae]